MASLLCSIEMRNVKMLDITLGMITEMERKPHLLNALLKAIELGFPECVEILLKHKALKYDNKNEALVKAMKKNNTEILKLLISSGVDINVHHPTHGPMLHFACKLGHAEVVSVLIDLGMSVNAYDKNDNTPLLLIAPHIHRSFRVFEILIQSGCELNHRNHLGKTALHYCCREGIGKNLLLQNGANPNVKDCDGNTPMHLAAIEGFDVVIKALLDHNACPDITNFNGMMPVHYLALKNHWISIEYIAEKGGILDAPDTNGKIPLWHAVSRNRLEAVKSLLKYSINIDCIRSPNLCVNSPLQEALDKSLFGIAKILVIAGCNLTPLINWVANIQNALQQAKINRNNQHSENISQDVNEESLEMLKWAIECLSGPPSLKQICRLHIRNRMGTKFKVSYKSLPLPNCMMEYISLQEVDKHEIESYLI